MSEYKVPQNVEAEDKLLGPFTFRQFVYLLIVAAMCGIAWGLYQLLPLLVIIPLPVIVFFGALALPLRKDQPMETYLAALVSFYLKPHRRMWDPDGIESLIEITVPKIVEKQLSKNITQDDAERRFSYLADLVDSEGWAIRGKGVQPQSTSMETDVFFTAQHTEDILDENNTVVQSMDYLMAKEKERLREETLARIRESAAAAAAPPEPAVLIETPSEPLESAVASPVIDTGASPVQADATPVTVVPPEPPTTSETTVSPDIMNLATNDEFSVETIAHEANRIHKKEGDLEDGDVISLR